MKSLQLSLLTAVLSLAACTPQRSTTTTSSGSPTDPSSSANAEVGKPAPDFTLPDLDGKATHLADLRGKIVILEWFNPGCPFVRASHTKGSLNGLSKRYTDKGVVWLAVDSSAPGKEGSQVAAIVDAKKRYGMDHAILRDESGDVGHRYGATNTPHMFVIDPEGTLVYRGAIDNSPDGEGESPTEGKLDNYVADAIDAVTAGRPVATRETRAYGCSVKY